MAYASLEAHLESVIDELLNQLTDHDGHSDEYGKIVKQLDLLYKMRLAETDLNIKNFEATTKERISLRETEVKESELLLKGRELDKPDRVSRDTLAIIAGNVAAVILVIGYERAHVVTTKALGFLMKR